MVKKRHENNDAESVVDRTVLRCCVLAISLSIVWLTVFFSLDLNTKVKGFVGAVGAIISFGCSSVPAKLPAAERIGTFRFQIFVTAGNTSTSLALAGLTLLTRPQLRSSVSLTPYGLLGALVLTATQCAAWPAVHRLGASVGPGIWCGVGMGTSFLWGVAVFHEDVRSLPAAVIAMALLVAGVALTAASQANEDVLRGSWPRWTTARSERQKVPSSKLDETALPLLPVEVPEEPTSTFAAFRTGVSFAVLTGLLDGTLMTAFTAYEKSKRGGSNGGLEYLSMSYLLSFGLALPMVAIPVVTAALQISERIVAHRGGCSSSSTKDALVRDPRPCADTIVALTGICSGFLWACGNFGSLHATLGLGQAIGFPLTQVCVLVSAGWGIGAFGEIPSATGRVLYAGASVLVLGGAVLLADQVSS